MSAPTSSALQALGNGLMLALCCECGNQRTCKRPKNYVYGECETWTRQTGDLKCSACQRVTRHAVVRGNDHDEDLQAAALGMDVPVHDKTATQDRWRQGLPRNPYLHHRFFTSQWEKAVKHNTRVRTLCGELVDAPEGLADDSSKKSGPYVRYAEVHHDPYQEYEDPATGLWWRDMRCTNCLRVSNALALERRREHLQSLMTTALVELINDTKAKLYDPHIEDLIESLERVHQRNT